MLAAELEHDPWSASLSPRQLALARYATHLTHEPSSEREARVDALRRAGFSDEEILHATQITAYFNFVNRMALGLGVELEGGPP